MSSSAARRIGIFGDSFLAAPARKVPGTRMVIAVTDPAQRAAIVTYLTRPAR